MIKSDDYYIRQSGAREGRNIVISGVNGIPPMTDEELTIVLLLAKMLIDKLRYKTEETE